MGLKEKISEKAIEEITEKLLGDMGLLHSGAAVTIENKSDLDLVRMPNKTFFFAALKQLHVDIRPLGYFGGVPPDSDVNVGEVEGFDICFTRGYNLPPLVWISGGCKWVSLWQFGGYELLTGIQFVTEGPLAPELFNPNVLTSIKRSGGFSNMSELELASFLKSNSKHHNSDSTLENYNSFGLMGYKGDGHYQFGIDLSKNN